MKPKQIETQIDNDLKTKIGYNKKTDVKDAEENEQKVTAHPDIADLDDRVTEDGRVGIGQAVACVNHHFVNEQQHPDRGQKRGHGVILGREAEAAQVDNQPDEPRPDGRGQKNDGGMRVERQEHDQADIGARQCCGPVGKVQFAHHAEDQREPDPDQRIGGAEQKPVHRGLDQVSEKEIVHVEPFKVGSGEGPGAQVTRPGLGV